MKFDQKVPSQLKETQVWFGSIISRAIDGNSCINPISPKGRPIVEEARDYIRPSHSLEPAQRIQIYNQQYWWRLLNALQETFPLVTRLFGYHAFNFTVGIPYLLKYPPNHWTLNVLGDLLPQWIEENYTDEDKRLIYDAALIDCAFCSSFTAAHLKPLDSSHVNGNLSSLMDLTLYLQPHLYLFQLPYDLFDFRVAFLKESPEHWQEHDFPPLAKEKQYHTVLFRNGKNDISWSEISPAEFAFLQQFKQGNSVSQACDWLEQQEDSLVEEASQNLHLWLKEWVIRQWLTLDS